MVQLFGGKSPAVYGNTQTKPSLKVRSARYYWSNDNNTNCSSRSFNWPRYTPHSRGICSKGRALSFALLESPLKNLSVKRHANLWKVMVAEQPLWEAPSDCMIPMYLSAHSFRVFYPEVTFL